MTDICKGGVETQSLKTTAVQHYKLEAYIHAVHCVYNCIWRSNGANSGHALPKF